MRILSVLLLALLVGPAHAGVPTTVHHQGRITDALGGPISGSTTLHFAIYGTDEGGSSLWSETQTEVPLSGGYYSIHLGAVTPLPANVFATGPLWLGVTVGTNLEMTPRTAVLSVPVAQAALGVEVASSPPVDCTEPAHRGRLFFDTTLGAFQGCDGVAWGALGGGSSGGFEAYGDGRDGAVAVTSQSVISTDPVSSSRLALGKPESEAFAVSALGASSITVAGSGTGGTASTSVSTTYLIGDELMVLEMVAPVGETTTVGTKAWCTVASVASATITCTTPLGATFGSPSTHAIQVLRVPHYSELNIASGGSLQVSGWDGAKGGVIALKVSGVATIDGAIDAGARGFRGGVTGTGPAEGITGRVANGGAGGGGAAGYQPNATYWGLGGTPNGVTASGRDGGDGGVWGTRRAGGGGSGDAGTGGQLGASSGIGATNSPPPNGVAGTGGGAAGGYGSGGGGGGAIPYAAGGFAGPADLSRLHFGGGGAQGGGGGGGGVSDNGPGGGGGSGGNASGVGGLGGGVSCTGSPGANGAAGGAGGGIIWLAADVIGVGTSGTIRAAGANGGTGGRGGNACNAGLSGGSGGGGGSGGDGASGGSIYLRGGAVALGTSRVLAPAGAGGSGGGGGTRACTSRCGGNGGSGPAGLDGSPGAIRVEYTSSVTGSTGSPAASVVQVGG